MTDEEKKEYEELKSLLYTGTITQYGKRKLIDVIEKQQKEIEELKNKYSDEKIRNTVIKRYREVIEKDYVSKDKIKAKIEEYRRLLYSYEKDLEEKLHYVDKGSMNCIIAQIQILQSLLEKE